MKTRLLHAIAGLFIVGSLALAHWVDHNWLWFTLFVGLNLLQYSITNWCLMAVLLGKLGVKD